MSLNRTDNISERAHKPDNWAEDVYVIPLDEVDNYLNEIEAKIDQAKDLLEMINSVDHLTNVGEALEIIQELSEELS